MSAAVYRHFSKTGELLYVGFSVKPMNRMLTHSNQASWFNEIETIKIEWFDTSEQALAAELLAIKTECPRENRKDMPDDLFLKRRARRKGGADLYSKRPHEQLDAIERAYTIFPGSWEYTRAGLDRGRINEIRESGRELLASEVVALKNSLSTTYKRLEQIGVHRGNKG